MASNVEFLKSVKEYNEKVACMEDSDAKIAKKRDAVYHDEYSEERATLLSAYRKHNLKATLYFAKVTKDGDIITSPNVRCLDTERFWECSDVCVLTRDNFRKHYIGMTYNAFLFRNDGGELFILDPNDLTYHLWCNKKGLSMLNEMHTITKFRFYLPSDLPKVEKDIVPGKIRVVFKTGDKYKYYRTGNFEIRPDLSIGVNGNWRMLYIKKGPLANQYADLGLWDNVYETDNGEYVLPVPEDFDVTSSTKSKTDISRVTGDLTVAFNDNQYGSGIGAVLGLLCGMSIATGIFSFLL